MKSERQNKGCQRVLIVTRHLDGSGGQVSTPNVTQPSFRGTAPDFNRLPARAALAFPLRATMTVAAKYASVVRQLTAPSVDAVQKRSALPPQAANPPPRLFVAREPPNLLSSTSLAGGNAWTASSRAAESQT
jgi:hypothetical protein